MGRKRADLGRADDYEEAVRVWRLAGLAANSALGLEHAVAIKFEDHRFPKLDDVVEEHEAVGGGQRTLTGWQIKRDTDTTSADVLRHALAELVKHPGLRAVLVTRDHTDVPGVGSLGNLGSFIERISAPGIDLQALDETMWAPERKWLELAQQPLGNGANFHAAVALLRRLQIESLGTLKRVEGTSLELLRAAFVDPHDALRRLQAFVPQARDPAVVVTAELLERDVLAGLSLRSDLSRVADGSPGVRELRPRIRNFARAMLQQKAWILTKGAWLDPQHRTLLPLSAESLGSRSAFGKNAPKRAETGRTLALVDAITEGRLVLLLGDMGSGKTTECASLALRMCDDGNAALPVLVPSGGLNAAEKMTSAELLSACSAFLSSEVANDLAPVDLSSLLRQGVKVQLVLDGLDEAGRAGSVALLTAAAAAVRNWDGLSVLASARLSESVLPPSGIWSRYALRPLDQSARRAFLLALLRVQGVEDTIAAARAAAVDARLRRSPHLATFGGTPLAAGLLAEAVSDSATDATVGDLIRRFVFLRLEDWSVASGRLDPETALLSRLPDAASRAVLLAELAEGLRASALPRDRALDILEASLDRHAAPASRMLADQALSFLAGAGLVATSRGEVSIPLASVSQYLAGFLMARRAEDQRAPVVNLELWREAAFAAGELRRRGTTDACRGWLTSWVEGLVSAAVVPGAAILVMEAQDAALAKLFVERLPALGRRPLWVYDDDRGESSAGIAAVLALAGSVGFRWFYDHYLDPRYPVPMAGSAIIDSVFLRWCLLSAGTLTDEQKDQLGAIHRAFAGSGGHGELGLVPPLVFVMPERLNPSQVVKHLVHFLGSPTTELAARDLLAKDVAQHPELVSQACQQAAAEGYESCLAASALWLELNPQAFDTDVADAVLKGRTRVDLQNRTWIRAISELRRRLGEARFLRYLRWSLLLDGDAAIGAAFVLWEHGERRLGMVGDAILHGLHGGVNCEGSAEVAESLMEAQSQGALGWLVMRFQQGRWDRQGAHAGWWRLLLRELARAGGGAPGAFAECVPAAQGFVLPRNQDLRNSIGALLDGTAGSPYREVLVEALGSLDVQMRHAAAMLFVACTLHPPRAALMELFRALSGEGLGNSWEWERLLMSIEFSAADTAFLYENRDRLPPAGRAMVLLIARKAPGGASSADEAALVRHLLAGDLTLIDMGGAKESILRSQAARETCWAEVDAAGPLATSAAEALLLHHGKTMTIAQRAEATALATATGYRMYHFMEEELVRASGDSEYAEALRAACRARTAGVGASSLLELLLASDGASDWEPVLARLFGIDAHDSHKMEEFGLLLLRSGLPELTRRGIGKAATALLRRAAPEGRRDPDGAVWLALLADEHDPDAKIDFSKLVSAGERSYGNALPAARARAQVLPRYTFGGGSSLAGRAGRRSLPAGQEAPQAAPSLEALTRAIAPDGPFDTQTMPALQGLVLSAPPESPVLLERASAEPLRWALAQGAVDWLDGLEPRAEVLVSGFPQLLERNRYRPAPIDVLKDWWWRTQRDALSLDTSLKNAVVAKVRARLLAGGSDPAADGAILLAMRRTLLDDEIERVVGAVLAPSIHARQLLYGLNTWIPEAAGTLQAPVLRRAIDAALVRLDSRDPGRSGSYTDPLTPLTLALAAWMLDTNEVAAAQRVFVGGLDSLGQRLSDRHERPEVFEHLAHLMGAVDRKRIRAALEFGAELGDDSTRAVCLLFLSGFRSAGDSRPVGEVGVEVERG